MRTVRLPYRVAEELLRHVITLAGNGIHTLEADELVRHLNDALSAPPDSSRSHPGGPRDCPWGGCSHCEERP